MNAPSSRALSPSRRRRWSAPALVAIVAALVLAPLGVAAAPGAPAPAIEAGAQRDLVLSAGTGLAQGALAVPAGHAAERAVPTTTSATTTTTTTEPTTTTSSTTTTSTTTTTSSTTTTEPGTTTSTTAVDPCDPTTPGDDPVTPRTGCPFSSPPPAVTNPALPPACGLKVMLVVDRSGSIATAGATGAVRNALTAFVDALNNTGSTVGLVDFSTTAAFPISYTALSDATRGTFDSYIANFNPSGRTNWDDALWTANNGSPDLTLFITDGMPNEYVASGHTGHPANTPSQDRPLHYAVAHANSIKSGGSRMFVVGVGEASNHQSEIASVSGPTPGTDVASADFSLVSDFDDLAGSLADLVFGLCASSMTVTKLVDGQPAPGWEITATATAVTPTGAGFAWRNPSETTALPASRSATTLAAGTATFEWVIGSEDAPQPGTATMSLDEADQDGYRFVGGTCSIDSQSGDDRTVTITALPVDLGAIPFDAIVRCGLDNETIPTAVPVAPTVTEAVCTGGALAPPSLSLPTTPNITYAAAPDGPYAPGDTVLVTATLAAGYAWGTLPTGWTEASPTTATYSVTFADVECTPVSPVAPTVVPAACVNAAVTAPTVMPGATTGITYTVAPAGPFDGTVDTTVAVTATVEPGYAFADPLPDGWTAGPTAATATFTVELAAASCTPVAPAAPTVTQAVCADGAVTEPALTLPETEGITYTTTPSRPVPGDVAVVTATLDAAGVAWADPLPDGWTRLTPTTASFTVVFEHVECTPVDPVEPAVTLADCEVDTALPASITLADTEGITYTIDPPGPYDPFVDTVVTVTATLEDGFAWATATTGTTGPGGFANPAGHTRPVQRAIAQLPDGWVLVSPTTATFTVTLRALPDCPAVQPTTTAPTTTTLPATTTTDPGDLSNTGASGIGWWIAGGAVLVAVGVGLVLVRRRRAT